MTNSGKEFTHTAYAYRRTGKKHGRLIECGVGRIDDDGKAHVHLDRTPINGFTGYVQLAPRGMTPEPPPEKPQRPGDDDGEAEGWAASHLYRLHPLHCFDRAGALPGDVKSYIVSR